MTTSAVGHSIKHRENPNDVIYTPRELASELVREVPFSPGETLLDPFRGGGAFFDYMPGAEWCEVAEGRDFFEWTDPMDWCISNPPWSMVDRVLEHTCEISRKGFAYLLANHGLTPRRLEIVEAAGFGLTKMRLSKVFKWYGIAAFCVFQRDAASIIAYDRVVWR